MTSCDLYVRPTSLLQTVILSYSLDCSEVAGVRKVCLDFQAPACVACYFFTVSGVSGSSDCDLALRSLDLLFSDTLTVPTRPFRIHRKDESVNEDDPRKDGPA